ncbi:PQQ-binding-like beta-propeller repeat protein [Shewanella sp. 10N.286.48.A6]|uniref:PQQ-binding-like beta-propeller repeat protein n=1 Tax=Shewanella sp. 10N.286.48.A6 TaxID=1880833 RepID=UPI000C8609A0|nr:PQQ-binding-like beta-propeller repeat protein [Shewanella sp. 10N.286.48.A6]PMH96976.1 hypothetical protein BCU55_19145 [Shewanella sp. 10N.286.48.A6]
MKIYKTENNCHLHISSLDSTKIYINDGVGVSYLFKNGTLSLENYEIEHKLGFFFNICGKDFRQVDYTNEENGTCKLISKNGEVIDFPDIFVDYLCPVSMASYSDELFFSYVSNYPKWRKSSLVIYNFLTKSITTKSSNSIFSKLIDEHVYGYERLEQKFIKRDLLLQTVWATDLNYSGRRTSTPIKWKGVVISFIGPEISENFVENTVSKLKESGGTLTGFNDDNGDIMWQLPIPEAIDALGLYHGKIYVAIYDKILIIDPQSGDVVTSIATNTALPGYRVSAAHIFVDGSYIYFTHAEDELLLIYDLNSYALLYTVPMPTGYRIKGHQFTDPNTGKHYFTLDNRTQDVADFPSLEVDPLNLSTQIEFEKEPEKTIELVVVASDELEHEIVINMHSSSLDDALRFGEIYTRDSASHHGFNHGGRTYGTRQPTPTFNGVIRFILSGCNEDQDLVLERLAMMEKRFTHWNEHEILGKGMYACTDKFKPVQLITKFNA